MPQRGRPPGAGPSGVYGSHGGGPSGSGDDIRLPFKETMEVHRDSPIASGPGEMPARKTATPAEFNLLLRNLIEQAVFMKLDIQIQEAQERWRLQFRKIENLQRLEVYEQWCLQIRSSYCRFGREHPPVLVPPATETMAIDRGLLEKVLEKSSLKVAQQNPGDLPITNTIQSWLNEQEDVVRRPESIASWSATASHISCAYHCSCRKEIPLLQSINQVIKKNQEKHFSFLTMGKSFAPPPYAPKDPPAESASSIVDASTVVFSLAPTTDSRAEEKKKVRKN